MSQDQGSGVVQEIRPQDRQFCGHPIGLWVLFTTEMWERFCYYGMRAFLVLYLVSALSSSNPGFGWSEKGAYDLYGWFTGLVYFFPLIGGYIADRFIGQHRSVLYGGILIAAGEFALYFTEIFRRGAQEAITMASAPGAFLTFFLGLTLITVGTGFFKPCISVMVGQLYGQNDTRRDVAFTYFYMGINVGALIAPFVAGTIAEKYGWHWGFLTAAVGMVFGLMTYTLFRPKYLGHIGKIEKKKASSQGIENASSSAATPEKVPLSRKEIDRIAVILILSFFTVAFWSVFEQAGSSLTTFAKRETNRQVPSFISNQKLFSPMLLPNEDEEDAILAFEETKRHILKANRSLAASQTEFQNASELLRTEGKNNPEYLKTVSDYDEASRHAAESIALADSAINKMNYARQAAGLEAHELQIPSMEELLALGEADAHRIDQLAAESGADRNEIIREESERAQNERRANMDPTKTIFTFPSTWYQSVNPFWIVVFAPLFASLWVFLGKRGLDPSTPVKFGIGLILLSIAFLLMIGGAIQAEKTSGNAGAYWLLCTYVLCTLGELCLSPVGLSMVTRLAPERYASFLMGAWFLSSAVAGYLSGHLAGAFGSGDGGGQVQFFFKQGLADYFLAMAIVPLLAGIVMFAISPWLRRMMHEDN